jgi:hypothetical protein
MAGNSNFDEILSTTLKNYVPKLTDNIFSARPLFYALTNGQTIRRISGGAKIVVPIIYGTNSTAGSYRRHRYYRHDCSDRHFGC